MREERTGKKRGWQELMEKVGINLGVVRKSFSLLDSGGSSAFLILESVVDESPSAPFWFTCPAQPGCS